MNTEESFFELLSSFVKKYNEQIIKIYTLKTYKECLEIIDEINKKTGKKVYDDTDTYYIIRRRFI